MVTIRIATEKDIPILVEYYLRQLQYHNEIEDLWDEEWMQADDGGVSWVQSYVTDEGKVFYIAEEDGKSLGYLQAEVRNFGMKKSGNIAILTSIHVVKDYRSQGIGQMLIDQFFKYAKENGANGAEVGVVHNNPGAKALYLRNGFGDHLMMMSKKLD